MKRFVWATLLLLSTLGTRGLSDQSTPPTVIAEFAGASLKWIHVAEPEFQRRSLNLDKYIISVAERNDSIMVTLSAPDAVDGGRGSSGSYPAFFVEISKKEMKVVHAYYIK